jgi:hypothetical protein
MPAMRARLAFFFFFLGGAALGCEVLVGIHDRSASPDAGDAHAGPADEGSAEAQTDGGCNHAIAPPRPTTDDGTANVDLSLAMRTVDFGVRADAGVEALGFDLDDLCTCPDPPSCAPFVPGDMHCDSLGGIDNAMASLLQQLTIVSQGKFDITGYQDAIGQGVYSLLLDVSGYNGGANDTTVTVSVFPSNGTIDRDFDGATWQNAGNVPAGTPIVPPLWDGHDIWTVDDDATVGQTARYFDTAAYVSNHVLVAHIDFPMRTVSSVSMTGAITTRLVGSVMTGTLVPEGSSYRMDRGVTGGRWPIRELSNALAEVPDQLVSGQYVCPGGFTYQEVKALMCKAADIPSDPTQTDPRYVCDALSVGTGFTAYPAVIGPRKPRPPTSSPCVDAAPTETCQ